MKTLLGALCLTATLTCAGCFTTTPREAAHAAPSTPLSAAKTAPPPVTVDQVNETNRWESAKRLEAEMQRDAKEP